MFLITKNIQSQICYLLTLWVGASDLVYIFIYFGGSAGHRYVLTLTWEVRGPLEGVGFLLQPCEFWG